MDERPRAFTLGVIVFTVFMARFSVAVRPQSELAGIWLVEEFETDGRLRPALATDQDRWHRVFFDYPRSAAIQRMDGRIDRFTLQLDLDKKTMKLTRPADPEWSADFTVYRPAPEQLSLAGSMGGVDLKMIAKRVPIPQFRLTGK